METSKSSKPDGEKSANLVILLFSLFSPLILLIHIPNSLNSGDPETMNNYPQSLNPFVDDFYDYDDNSSTADSFHTAEPPQFSPPPPPSVHMSHLKLPPFWMDAPVAWFAAVEAQFRLRRVWSQEEQFCHVTAALDKMSMKKVVHLVVTPDPLQPYTKLKDALLASHQLTDFQRVELLHAMEPLGGRKPSELLADMWELCPANQHDNIFFAMLFLQRLPRDIRVLLTHEDHGDLRLLAAKADRLVAFGGRTDTVAAATAAEELQDGLVAALPGKNKHTQQQRNNKNQKKQPPPVPPRPDKEKFATAPATLARNSAGLCYYHWSYGDKANNCTAPCSWQGN